VLAWERAAEQFRDATGRPGPSTWEAGAYPEGQDDFLVSGVSWYEAAAYAEFAHKRIPTVYHWFRAANLGIWSDILHFSNFDRSGPERVGTRHGLGRFGTFDMAGNVREWCWNATGNRRYILGGAWNDERFVYSNMNAVSPFDRSAANGFRCVKYSSMRFRMRSPHPRLARTTIAGRRNQLPMKFTESFKAFRPMTRPICRPPR
jgi:formylglycine-generating enzyme required for sulfatase activity